jgi:hypothetical protein
VIVYKINYAGFCQMFNQTTGDKLEGTPRPDKVTFGEVLPTKSHLGHDYFRHGDSVYSCSTGNKMRNGQILALFFDPPAETALAPQPIPQIQQEAPPMAPTKLPSVVFDDTIPNMGIYNPDTNVITINHAKCSQGGFILAHEIGHYVAIKLFGIDYGSHTKANETAANMVAFYILKATRELNLMRLCVLTHC